MIRNISLTLVTLASLSVLSAHAAPGSSYVYSEIKCNGEAVVRVAPGQLRIVQVDKNIPGCIGPQVAVVDWIGTPNRPQPTRAQTPTPARPTQPALDLASTDTVNYRIDALEQQGVQYANPVRSVRMRDEPTTASDTEAYLMRNDPVIVTGEGARWTPATGAEVEVIDSTENTIAINTEGRADGYVRSRYLRDPNPSDLVRIGQADQAYWSDSAHVNVAHLVNVRANPWYKAKIVKSLKNGTKLYVISTVDDWSEVITDDRSVHGYIKSEFLVIDRPRRREQVAVK